MHVFQALSLVLNWLAPGSALALAEVTSVQTGVQGTYTHIVGKRGQGLFQSFFLASTALGRTAGAQWVGVALQSMSTTTLWTIAFCNFMLLWVSFGCNYGRYHPAHMKLLNGDNALLGPSVRPALLSRPISACPRLARTWCTW